mmetsp:Transcript_24899/g.59096  ORF Transcript_24899/g.59096 Transcript_24899/m.59096 type:complete len:679 (-) Transcript_24899:1572-3608(-)
MAPNLNPGADVEAAMPVVPPPSHAQSKTNRTGGRNLRWSRITKEVQVKEQSAGLLKGSIANQQIAADSSMKSCKTKIILNAVSGSAEPGQVISLMGPSGSGKTTLLDVLSGRSSFDGGVITLDGEVVDERIMKKLKKKVAYVKQNDLFFGHLTVRDQLTYTALLRLPSKWPRSKKTGEVDRIIKQLRLTKCQDTPIFQISGGEKKRVNIGSELLTDPSILLLDEPTSGLDSTSAVALMKILDKLARDEGKTIITSIHQPSSAVFFAFDKLMLLADGNVVYFGTPIDSLEYVRELGMECPAGYNAADHHMDLLVVDSAIDDEDDSTIEEAASSVSSGVKHRSIGGTTTKQKLIASWDAEALAKKVDEEAKADFVAVGPPRQLSRRQSSLILRESSFKSTWFTQFMVLVHRSMKNSRSAIFTKLNLVKSGAIGLMSGLLWFQMPYTERTVYDRSSYYFFTMTFWVFDAMFTAYLAFPLERAIIFKERSSGSYRLSAYFFAKTTSEAPSRLALPSLYMVISYWMSGVNNNFGVFIASTLCSLLSVLAGESIGLFCGAAVLDMEKGMVIMTVLALSLMVVGGFFVRNVPFWILWLGYVSPFKYSYNSSVQLVFDRPVPCDGSGVLAACGGRSDGYASEEDVLDFLGTEFSAGLNAGLLLLIFVVVRIFAFLALKSKKPEERS